MHGVRNRTYKYTVDLCVMQLWNGTQNRTMHSEPVGSVWNNHLFERKRYKDAEDRMLSIEFMSRFHWACESIETPLRAWQ